jgi:chaperone BCS1
MTLVRSERSGKIQDGKFVKLAAGETDPTESQNFVVTCFPTLRGTAPIQEFLDHVRHFSEEDTGPPQTTICRAFPRSRGQFSWDRTRRTLRAIQGVVIEVATKMPLIADIEYCLSKECRTFYENRGIPYRRGYLFYGTPGTGKTSFAVAMAGHFRLPIYVFSLSDTEMSDAQLAALFDDLSSRCVLLLEDVDSAGLNRESMSAKDGKKVVKKGVTLSGLLNCLDGPCSVDGRLLCMTSNSPDSIDAALVRPGRCEKILFGYTCPEVSAQMFTNIYTKSSAELYAGEIDHAAVHDLPELAKSFANSIPIDAHVTPAECQAYLLANRVNPLAAVNGAAAWAAEIIANKLRGANVAKFSNEVNRPAKAVDAKASSTPSSPTVTSPTTATPDSVPPTPPPSEGSGENDDTAAQVGADEDDHSDSESDSSESGLDDGPSVMAAMSDFDRDATLAELNACYGDDEKILAFGRKYNISVGTVDFLFSIMMFTI